MTEPKELALPDTVEATINMLDRAFPLRNFSAGMNLADIHRELGKRDVIDFLRSLQAAKAGKDLGEDE
jgi:hypothetical protein